MHRQTKAVDISPSVRQEVWERDGQCCILCGSHSAAPNAHYIPRSHGGLGIPENIVTLCADCHSRYDNGAGGIYIKREIAGYLKSKYPSWDEGKLVYKKYD